ncbi:hypothetical protein [Paraburkholderia graminis]
MLDRNLNLYRQGEKVIDLDAAGFPFQLDPDGPDGVVLAKIEVAQKTFAVGDQIRWTPDELLGICLSYQMVIDRVTQAVQEDKRLWRSFRLG